MGAPLIDPQGRRGHGSTRRARPDRERATLPYATQAPRADQEVGARPPRTEAGRPQAEAERTLTAAGEARHDPAGNSLVREDARAQR